MIVQWNGEDLELGSMGKDQWEGRLPGDENGSLVLRSIGKEWLAQSSFGDDDDDSVWGPTPQAAVDGLRKDLLTDFERLKGMLGVALNGPERPKPEAFPKKWHDCPEFAECLKARDYVLLAGSGYEGLVVMSAGLYMYELWQDGKRGSGS